ncbi:MAG: helix-turn-helix domain-containing protein [Sandaracinaceae bacterium]
MDYESASSELLRALRGPRSQVALARRLGYRGNPITDWENGRRYPNAIEALRVAERCGVDVEEAFLRFHETLPLHLGELPKWLNGIRATRSVSALARAMGCSRYSVARWLKGASTPRLPDFLRLVDAITGRVTELVAELVLIEEVPAFQARHRAVVAARTVAVDEPWSEAILRVIETSSSEASDIAAQLKLEPEIVRRVLARLAEANIVERRPHGYHVVGDLNVDTFQRPGARDRLREHWSGVLAQRAGSLREHETFGYNLMSLSEEDFHEAREVLRRAYREIRSLAATSTGQERVAFVGMGLLELGGDPDSKTEEGS